MRFVASCLASCLALVAVSGVSATAQDKPITDDDPDMMDVAKTPVTDLNLDREEIPAMLIAAQRQPYALEGLGSCRSLVAEVRQLDEILGPDLDLPQEERDRLTAGKAGKFVVSSLIPFRGLIREVSGAAAHEEKVDAAIQAGLARRGFLKGVGATRDCAYPARPATRTEVAAYMAKDMAEEQQTAETRQARKEDRQRDRKKNRMGEVSYTSQEVVQKVD